MGVHVLAFLGQDEGACCTSEEISRSINTNPVVVRRIVGSLQEAGLLETQKGPSGGAKLTRCPHSITLGQIYRAVEEPEPLALHRTPPSPDCPVGRTIEAILERVFADAQNALESRLDQTHLSDILAAVKSTAQAHHPQ